MNVSGFTQVVANYPLTTDFSASSVSPNITASQINISNLYSGYIADDGFGTVFETYPNATSYTASISGGFYFAFTIHSNTTMPNMYLQFFVGKGGNSNPRAFAIRSSLDNFATDLYTETLPCSAQAAPTERVVAVPSNGVNSVTFRFYEWSPSRFNSVDYVNLSVLFVV